MDLSNQPGGRVITFYSYKGGTGRSMALANVAWLLASSGRRVLVIDWDLEAPGLHRYFAPFLADKDLSETEGLIDFVWDFATEAMTPSEQEEQPPTWFEPLADFQRYAVTLEYDFPPGGAIDFVPAGRQDSSYPDRFSSFDWKRFYEGMGGGVFLEAARQRAREDYQYILIDSRTGISDTSGICTLHLPDVLVVCFTANNQSIKGAAEVAASVRAQWAADPARVETASRIYPLLTRVDPFERARLDRRRDLAKAAFMAGSSGTAGLPGTGGLMEVPYIPFYSYEETLAAFGDKPDAQEAVLLPSMERLVALLTDQQVTRLETPPRDAQRLRVLARFEGRDDDTLEIARRSVAASSYDVFLSCAASDASVVEELAWRLREAGLQPWLASWELQGSETLPTEVEAALAVCSSAAVIVGPSGLSEWQTRELQIALERRAAQPAFRIIPLLLPGAEERLRDLPPILRAVHPVNFQRTLADPKPFEQLVAAIRRVEPDQRVVSTENPYRGFLAFDEHSPRYFFGREKETQALVDSLRRALEEGRSRFVAVIGASGSGKSSLVQAGLLPKLRQNAINGSQRWPIITCRPGSDPLQRLAEAVLEISPVGWSAARVTEAVTKFRSDDAGLDGTVRAVLQESGQADRLLLFIDQFEELFTHCRDESACVSFIDNLLRAAGIPDGPTIVVVALRADSYSRSLAHERLSKAISETQFVLGPLNDEELRRAIERPAQLVGCELEPGLVEVILSDIKGAPGALPLLQSVLAELWDRRTGRRLTLEAYARMGGIAGALSRQADEVLQPLDDVDRQLCRRILLRLVRPGDGTADSRARAAFADLIPARDDPERVRRLIQTLVEGRLITMEGPSHGEGETVQIAHEALIHHWPVLKDWINSERDSLRTWRRISDAAREWQGSGRAPDFLWSGARLLAAQKRVTAHRPELNALELAFLDSSIDGDKRERVGRERALVLRRRRSRMLGAATAASLMVITAALVVAYASGRGTRHERDQLKEQLAQAQSDAETAQQRSQDLAGRLQNVEADLTSAAEQAESLRGQLAEGRDELQVARQKYEESELLRLAAHAELNRETNPQLAALLAVEALNAANRSGQQALIAQARQSLQQALGERAVKTLEARRGASFVAPANGRRFVTVAERSDATVWEFSAGGWNPRPLAASAGGLTPRLLSGDGRWLVMNDPRGPTQVHDLDSPGATPVVLRETEGGLVRDAAIETKSSRVAVLFVPADPRAQERQGPQHVLAVWNLTAPDRDFIVPADADTLEVSACLFISDGRWLVAAGQDSQVVVWDAADLAAGPAQRWDVKGAVTSLAAPADGQRLAAGGNDGTVRIWDLGESKLPEPRFFSGHRGSVIRISFSPDGGRLATVGIDGTARVWDLGQPDAPLRVFQPEGAPISAAAFSHAGTRLATAEFDGGTYLWDLAAPEAPPLILRDLNSLSPVALDDKPYERPRINVAFASDDRWLISGGDSVVAWLLPAEDLVREAQQAAARNFGLDEWRVYFPGQVYRATFPDLAQPQQDR